MKILLVAFALIVVGVGIGALIGRRKRNSAISTGVQGNSSVPMETQAATMPSSCALGADCAFFVYNTPCLAEGIGDRLTPIPLSLGGFRLIMLKPDVHISTREAYGGIQLSGDQPSLAALVRKGISPIDLVRHGDIIYNDFERTVFPLHPELSEIKQRLLAAGAVYAAMSGSGSTVYGLFEADSDYTTLADYGLTEPAWEDMLIYNDIL